MVFTWSLPDSRAGHARYCGNSLNGVYIVGATSPATSFAGIRISQTSRWGSTAAFGATANDTDDADTGPNSLQHNTPGNSGVALNGANLHSPPLPLHPTRACIRSPLYLADAAGQEGQIDRNRYGHGSGVKAAAIGAGDAIIMRWRRMRTGTLPSC